jgi:dolichyl-phosphate beta-glucosyltransferase
MSVASPSLLLVIPCYKESQRLPVFLRELCLEIQQLPEARVLIVDDGSGLEEQLKLKALINETRAHYPFVQAPLLLAENIGKGGTVYTGWDAADAGTDWLALVDADGSCSATEVRRLAELAFLSSDETQAIFASRVKMLGRSVHRLLKRHLMGRVFATLVSELLAIPVYDSQCGLKLVRRSAYESVKNRLQVRGFAFDVELLTALLDAGHAVREEPIDWREVPGGKVHVLRDSWRMFRDVLRIRANRSPAKSSS